MPACVDSSTTLLLWLLLFLSMVFLIMLIVEAFATFLFVLFVCMSICTYVLFLMDLEAAHCQLVTLQSLCVNISDVLRMKAVCFASFTL